METANEKTAMSRSVTLLRFMSNSVLRVIPNDEARLVFKGRIGECYQRRKLDQEFNTQQVKEILIIFVLISYERIICRRI